MLDCPELCSIRQEVNSLSNRQEVNSLSNCTIALISGCEKVVPTLPSSLHLPDSCPILVGMLYLLHHALIIFMILIND